MIRTASTLIGKDLSEHAIALVLLAGGFLATCVMVFIQVRGAAMSSGSAGALRLVLLTMLPLVAFIVGNRLIVREYLGKTRIFVEALPIPATQPLLIKYFLGFVYLAILTLGAVALTVVLSGDGEDITSEFAALLLLKSVTLVSVLWSIVFSISLFGRLRLIFYVIVIWTVILLNTNPAIDIDQFGPFALLDNNLFAHERDVIPWWEIIVTLEVATVIAAIGFVLALWNEGSLAETLSKPMNQRDYVAITVVVFAVMVINHALTKDWDKTPYAFSGDMVIRSEDPKIAVRYEAKDQESRARGMVDRLSHSLHQVQQTLGTSQFPPVRISLNTQLNKQDVHMWTDNGVIIEANYHGYTTYQNTVLEAHALHGIFQILTDNRAVFEPKHWITDGLTRWWAATPLNKKQRGAHDAEVYARAIIALDRAPLVPDLIENWQIVADATGLAAAEALAYTAIDRLAQTHGENVLQILGRQTLAQAVPTGIQGPLRDRIPSAQDKFESVTGTSWNVFMTGWRKWLDTKRNDPAIGAFLNLVPAINATISATTNANGVHSIVAHYQAQPGFDTVDSAGVCVMKHEKIDAFDAELWISNDQRVDGQCVLDDVAHRVDSEYAPGDRVYVSLEFEHPKFHWPVILNTRRVTIR